jgi:hypothetical protein
MGDLGLYCCDEVETYLIELRMYIFEQYLIIKHSVSLDCALL